MRNLTETSDGRNPTGNNLIQASNGYLYGMITNGGTNGGITIFRLIPSTKTFTVIRNLAAATDGSYPYGSLLQGSVVTCMELRNPVVLITGELFSRFQPVAPYLRYYVSSPFPQNGGHSKETLIKGADGNLYGMTADGGTSLYGTVFKISNTGTNFTVLANFNGASYGNAP